MEAASSRMWDAHRQDFRALVLTLSVAGLTLSCGDGVSIQTAQAQEDRTRKSIVALARLEPASRVVDVASATPDVVKQVLVREGNEIVQGQVLVLLATYPLRSAELEEAQLELERANLKPLEVAAQEARLRAIEAELEFAKGEVQNQKDLSSKGFSAGHELRDAKLKVRRSEEQLTEARVLLEHLQASSLLQVREARNAIDQAEARLEQTVVRSPLDGTVLRILTHEGESVGRKPVIKVGTTQSMYAVAEVHANEIRLIQLGQPTIFSSPALEESLKGTVESIGEIISGNAVRGADPTLPRGLRVVEVRAKLEPNELAQRLTNLEGELRIGLEPATATTTEITIEE